MDVIAFPVNLKTTSGLSISMHGVISLPYATSYDKITIKNIKIHSKKISSHTTKTIPPMLQWEMVHCQIVPLSNSLDKLI